MSRIPSDPNADPVPVAPPAIPSLWMYLFDPKTIATVAGAIILMIGVWRDWPVEKIALFEGLIVVYVGGTAFHQGKNLEGSIPPGRAPAAQTSVIIQGPNVENGGASAGLQGEAIRPYVAELRPIEGGGEVKGETPTLSPGEVRAGSATIRPNRTPAGVTHGPLISPAFFVAILSLLFVGGCAGTSKPFQMAVGDSRGVAHRVSVEEAAYVAKDATLSPADAQRKATAAAALDFSTVTQSTISVDRVAAAWAAVKADYLAYVNADAIREDSKAVRRANANALDLLIQHERGRSFFGGSPPAPVPVVAPVPASMPSR